jgi:large subunit ribosomal protein L4
MKTEVYNQKGEKTGTIDLPEKIFNLKWNSDLVHQVVTSMQSNKRVKVAHVKMRGEVAGSGIKPWRQKGTGRARHGSFQSPIWIGGGVTHGPHKEKDYSKKINKKMRKLAFFTALSQKLRDKEIFFLDKIALDKAKTKEANAVVKSLSKIEGLEKLSFKKNNRVIFALDKKNPEIATSFRNLPGISINETKNLNALDILTYKYLIFVNYK